MIKNADIIVFNRVKSADRRDGYVPTFINGVSWVEHMDSSHGQDSSKIDVKATIRIPLDADISSGRSYVDQYEYERLQGAEKMAHWSVQTGRSFIMRINESARSLFADGEVYGEPELRSSGFKMLTAVEFADNTFRGHITRHWRIGGA